MKYAILVDAGFIKTKLGSQAEPLTAAKVDQFIKKLRAHEVLAKSELHRIYWYDAPPLDIKLQKPLQGGTLDLGSTALGKANKELHAELCRMPYFSLRSGNLAMRGWKIRKNRLQNNAQNQLQITANDLEPSIQQKGVDMRLGLDIAALTLKGHVEALVLVSGDSDFVPAMKFARREGAQIFLVTLGHKIRPEMLEHSDMDLQIT